MNLYKLHSNPESLLGYEEAMKDPEMAWGTHENNHDKLRELEDTWTKSAQYSYWYALYILKDRFPQGEDVIATDARYSCWYAEHVLKPLGIRGFPKGEDAIVTSAQYSYWYARDVLENRFPKGEDVIRGSEWQASYEHIFGIKLSL
jgi:hypothetical protein